MHGGAVQCRGPNIGGVGIETDAISEVAETLTWNQIGLLPNRSGVLDVGEFWQPLLSLFDVTMHKHILKAKNRELILDDAARCSTAS